jgi:hypothetical protein
MEIVISIGMIEKKHSSHKKNFKKGRNWMHNVWVHNVWVYNMWVMILEPWVDI